MSRIFRSVCASLALYAVFLAPTVAAPALSAEQEYNLEKFSTPDPNPLVEADRDLVLARVLASHCGLRANLEVLRTFAQKSGVLDLTPEKKKDVEDSASARFDYMDVGTFAAPCSVSDCLYGPTGKLIPGALSVVAGAN